MERIIEIENLDKSFGKIHAVNDLSFSVRRGELFAFLGVNGAGKSTTISIICAQLAKDSGKVIVCGEDIDKDPSRIASRIGVVFQNSLLDQALSVRDNLESRAALYGITGKRFSARLSELSKLLDLDGLMRRTVGKLSGGQRRRIDIARALVHRPEVLILDEPTTGLDPQTRRMIWSVIETLRRDEGLTVFLTTHYMEEAADADYVIILDDGRISASGSPLALKNKFANDYITLYGSDIASAEALGYPVEKIGDACRITVSDTAAATKLIIAHPNLFLDYEVTKGKMDDVFLAVTGKKLGGGEAK